MERSPIRLIIVDPSVRNTPAAARIIEALPETASVDLENGLTPTQLLEARGILIDKNVYFLTRSKGTNFKKCPGITEHYVCCGLHTVDSGKNCPLACSYCFLQSYLAEKYSTIYVDHPAVLAEIGRSVASQPRRLFRVGTGELTDSLALDPLTRFSRELVPFFATLPNAVLELKTKSIHIENLLDLDHHGRTVISWSVNPPKVVESEEPGCAPIEARLAAARRVADAGYYVAFHFDPMIDYVGCHADYDRLADQLFDAVPVDKFAWISIGSLRFSPEMQRNALERYPHAKAMLGEIVNGYDGKARYLRPVRYKLYETITAALRRRNTAGVFTYFCMESPEVWKRFMGEAPSCTAELDFRFAENLRRRFPHFLAHSPQRADYVEPWERRKSSGKMEPRRNINGSALTS